MWAIKFDDVSKRYRTGGARYASLRQDVSQLSRTLLSALRRKPKSARGKLALDHVSFEVEEGDSCAIIGPNGAGKTTALRLLTRISYPSGGRIQVRGRVAALIEVGSGIHPELTGRENIWLYGRILGMPAADIARRFDEIVDFAEIEEALDTPVKMYSSGMAIRLGFSVASHLSPDIFVVDEALAVGDAVFQARCVNRMQQLVREGKTLLFVSHHFPAVEALCQHGIFLLDGHVEAVGNIREVIGTYLKWVDTRQDARIKRELQQGPPSAISIEEVSLYDAAGTERRAFHTGEDIEIRLRLRAAAPMPWPAFAVAITDGRPGPLILCSMAEDGQRPGVIEGTTTVSCRLHRVPLMPRVYQLACNVRDWNGSEASAGWRMVGSFRIDADSGDKEVPVGLAASMGAPIHVDHEWGVLAPVLGRES
jgi:ABC-type polysaccharide/polyol phosphate transport system ATPase subunit